MLSLKSLFGENATILQKENFQILLLVALISPFGNGLLSPILDSLIDPFGASTATIGWLISFFWAPAIIVIPIAGVLADRHGRKPILVASLTLFGLAGTAIMFTTNFYVALLLRVVQGIGWAGLVPIVVTSIGDLYSGSEESTAQGLRMAGAGLAGAIISLLAGTLVMLAWGYPFLLHLLVIPVVIIVYLWFEEPTTSNTTVAPKNGHSRSYRQALFHLVRQRRVFVIVIARGLPLIVWIGFSTYNSIIVIQFLDGTAVQAGILYALASLVYAGAASQAGRVTALFDSRYPSLGGANVGLVVGFGIVLFAQGIVVASIGVMILAASLGIVEPLYRSLLTSFAPASLRAGLVSIAATGSRISGMLTPIAMGGVIATVTPVIGFTSAVQIAGLGAAIIGGGGGILCILVARTSSPVRVDHLRK